MLKIELPEKTPPFWREKRQPMGTLIRIYSPVEKTRIVNQDNSTIFFTGAKIRIQTNAFKFGVVRKFELYNESNISRPLKPHTTITSFGIIPD